MEVQKFVSIKPPATADTRQYLGIFKRVFIKYVRSDFVILDAPRPFTCTIKESKTKLKSKETMEKRHPEITLALFNCTGEIRMDHFGYLNSSFHFTFIL